MRHDVDALVNRLAVDNSASGRSFVVENYVQPPIGDVVAVVVLIPPLRCEPFAVQHVFELFQQHTDGAVQNNRNVHVDVLISHDTNTKKSKTD